ncbi:MAG: phosphoesterase [Synechococcaceae cyanobacterium]
MGTLFVLGDVIGPERDCNALLKRLQQPRRGELEPQCLYGWWEDQLLAERGHRGERRADALRLSQGEEAVEALLQAVDPAHMNWLAALQFGFIELDCALLHGSSAAVDDNLTPDSSPLLLLDRLSRLDVNRLFTARSGQQFRLELSGGGIESQLQDLEGQRHHQQSVPRRQVIGIGAGIRYTLYDPGSDRLDFRIAGSKAQQRARGFA